MSVSLSEVNKYFGYPNLSAFSADWKALSIEDRDQIKAGLEDGSLTY